MAQGAQHAISQSPYPWDAFGASLLGTRKR